MLTDREGLRLLSSLMLNGPTDVWFVDDERQALDDSVSLSVSLFLFVYACLSFVSKPWLSFSYYMQNGTKASG